MISPYGERLRKFGTQQVIRETASGLSAGLREALEPLLREVESLNERIQEYDRYRIIFRQLDAFAKEKGIRFVKHLDFVKLSQFRASWKDGALSGQKKLERVRATFGFAKKMKAIVENPALDLEMPIVKQAPTLPFTQDEMTRIVTAAAKKIAASTGDGRAKWRRARALILFLPTAVCESRMLSAVEPSASRMGSCFSTPRKLARRFTSDFPKWL